MTFEHQITGSGKCRECGKDVNQRVGSRCTECYVKRYDDPRPTREQCNEESLRDFGSEIID